jgi:hypothetical protein
LEYLFRIYRRERHAMGLSPTRRKSRAFDRSPTTERRHVIGRSELWLDQNDPLKLR